MSIVNLHSCREVGRVVQQAVEQNELYTQGDAQILLGYYFEGECFPNVTANVTKQDTSSSRRIYNCDKSSEKYSMFDASEGDIASSLCKQKCLLHWLYSSVQYATNLEWNIVLTWKAQRFNQPICYYI